MSVLSVAAVTEATGPTYDFSFMAFTLLGASTDTLELSCDVDICLLNTDGSKKDSSCGVCPTI